MQAFQTSFCFPTVLSSLLPPNANSKHAQVPRKGILDAQEDQMGNSNVSMLNLENATARLTLDSPRQWAAKLKPWAKLTPVDRGFNGIQDIKIFKNIHKIGRDPKNDTVSYHFFMYFRDI